MLVIFYQHGRISYCHFDSQSLSELKVHACPATDDALADGEVCIHRQLVASGPTTPMTNRGESWVFLDSTFSHVFFLLADIGDDGVKLSLLWQQDCFEDHCLLLFPSNGITSSDVSCVKLSTVTWLMTFSKPFKELCCAVQSAQLEEQLDLSSKT